MDLESIEIRLRADECLSDFDALVIVQPASDNHRNCNDLNIEEQRARFLIWSANIGIFADGHASLDYRLRENWDARNLMLDLLESLQNYIRRGLRRSTFSYVRRVTDNILALATVKPDDEDEELLASLTIAEDNVSSVGSHQAASASSILSSSYQGSATDESLSISVDQDRTPFEQRLHGIEHTIDRLYRLSVAIRRPSMASQNLKAANFVIRDEVGNDVGKQFADFALTWITHQFPEAPPLLRERLARSVTIRRKRFLYRQSHQKKLGKKSLLTPPPRLERSSSPGHDVTSTVVSRTVVETTVVNTQSKPRHLHRPNLLSQTSASKVSGEFKTQDIFDTPSRAPTVFSGAFTQQESILIPDPPKPAAGSKEFECPYCCMILPMKEAVQSNWRYVLFLGIHSGIT